MAAAVANVKRATVKQGTGDAAQGLSQDAVMNDSVVAGLEGGREKKRDLIEYVLVRHRDVLLSYSR